MGNFDDYELFTQYPYSPVKFFTNKALLLTNKISFLKFDLEMHRC